MDRGPDFAPPVGRPVERLLLYRADAAVAASVCGVRIQGAAEPIVLDGDQLIVGGEGHPTGSGKAQPERYERLEAFARAHWDLAEITHRWSAHDLMPADGLPFAGPVTPFSRSIWVAAGFRKWGLTNGTLTALVLAYRIMGRDSAYAALLDSTRRDVLAQALGVPLPSLVSDEPDDAVDLAWVPGSFELPLVARRLARAPEPFIPLAMLRDRVVGEYRDYFESFVHIDDPEIEKFVRKKLASGEPWPDAVLQLGGRLTSKRVQAFLEWAALPDAAGGRCAAWPFPCSRARSIFEPLESLSSLR